MSAEVEINAQTFGPRVESLKHLDKRILSISKIEHEISDPLGLEMFAIKYKNQKHEGEIYIAFTPDQEPKSKESKEWGEHTVSVDELFLKFENHIPEDEIQDLIDWWNTTSSPDTFVHIKKLILGDGTKVLSFGYEDLATAYLVETIDYWVKEIIDNMPKVITKAKEIGLIS